MATIQIRVPEHTHQKLQRMAESQHRSVGSIAAEAVERFDRDLFWNTFDEQFDALRSDPDAWAEVTAEIRAFDVTLSDGLDGKPE